MSLLKTISFLLLLAILVQPFHALDEESVSLLQTGGENASEKLIQYSSKDYRNIRMVFDTSNMETFNRNSYGIIFDPISSFFAASLKVLPSSSKLVVPDGACGSDVKIPESASVNGYDADIAVFVNQIYNYSADFITKSMVCATDKTTNRPTIAKITINTALFDRDNEIFHISVYRVMHEVIHALGFRSDLYPLYINPETLKPLENHILKKKVNGVEITVLNLPPLTQRLRTYFNCPTLEGAYLENQESPESISSHFERRIFGSELMTASFLRDSKISEFTLAVLEGTGWYQVSYEFVDPMTYGKNAGCAFLDTKCVNPKTLKPNFKEFCSPLVSEGIAWTAKGLGACGTKEIKQNLDLIDAFDYWGNKTVVDDPFADNCPTVQYVRLTDCEFELAQFKNRLWNYENYQEKSRAFLGTLAEDSTSEPLPLGGYCFPYFCEKKEDDNYSLKVQFYVDAHVTCDRERDIDASDFDFPHSLIGALRCPNPNEFCEKMQSDGSLCKAGCFANGKCVEGRCKCNPGWSDTYGSPCEIQTTVDNCPRCTQDPLRTTCYGNECICNTYNTTCQCLLGLESGPKCSQYLPIPTDPKDPKDPVPTDPKDPKDTVPTDPKDPKDPIPTDPKNSGSDKPEVKESQGSFIKLVLTLASAMALTSIIFWLLNKKDQPSKNRREEADNMEVSLTRPLAENNRPSAVL